MKKLLLMLALLLLPFALADISITCSPSSVQPGEAVNCNAATTTTLNNVGRLSFTVNPGTLFEITSTSGLAGVTFNPANGIGVYTNAQGINFNANAVLFTINLRAKTGVQGSESISFSRFIVRDTTPVDINFGTVRNSNMITVGSAGRACSEADWCGPWSTCPAGTQTRTCNTPAGAACTSGVTAEPAETQSCTPSCAGVADGAACTLSGAAGTCQSGGCQTVPGTCTARATTCNVAGVSCPNGPSGESVRLNRIVCPSSTPCNPTTGLCQAVACTARATTCIQAGVSCPSGSSGAAVTVAQVVCSDATPVCNTITGLCEAAPACIDADNDRYYPGEFSTQCFITGQPLGFGDCNDNNPLIHPSDNELICNDGLVNDCNGFTDCADVLACVRLACVTGGVAGTCQNNGICQPPAGRGATSCTEGQSITGTPSCNCDAKVISGATYQRHEIGGQCTLLLGKIKAEFESSRNALQKMVNMARLLRCYISSTRATCMEQ